MKSINDLKEKVFKLTSTYGVSGLEGDSAKMAKEMLSEYADVSIDNLGNVVGVVNANATGNHILLDAHNDQIGFIVTYIDSDGFIKFDSVGGVDRRVVTAKPVIILGKQRVKGVITSIPPHLASGDDKLPEFSDMSIDTGLSYDEVTALVSVGDRIVIDIKPIELLGDVIASPALDDRASIVAILRCLEILKKYDYNTKITVLFSCQEETSGNGAMVGSFNAMPNEAIAIDVTHAKTKGTPSDGTESIGSGAIICYAPILDYDMSSNLVKIAKENNIKYGLETSGRRTGTNCDEISMVGSGIKCGLISIPLKYMHTCVEVCNLNDIESVAQLLAKYILSCN